MSSSCPWHCVTEFGSGRRKPESQKHVDAIRQLLASCTQRKACDLIGLEPKTYRYQSARPGDGALRQRLRELASQRRRFGYRRLHLLLEREGISMNWKKLYRIYREEKLTVRKRGGRKRALGTRAPMAIPQGANQRWSLDLVSDALSDGRRFRVLCVMGLSGILCSGPVSLLTFEPFAEDDGELGSCLEPFTWSRFQSSDAWSRKRYSNFIAASSLGK